jgi:hypothetical protein
MRELAAFGGPRLVARGLRVEELTGEEVTAAQNVRTACLKVSCPTLSLAPVRGLDAANGRRQIALTRAGAADFVLRRGSNICELQKSG